MNEKIKKIKALVLDVDGILTDGKIIIDSHGEEIKYFDVQDGFGLVLFKKAGFKTAIISAREAKAVTMRAKDLKIDKVYQNAIPKIDAYEKLLKDLNVRDEEVCYMGDDLPDIPVLKRAGLAIAVPNAVAETKRVCNYITRKNGGDGAVREVVELILKTQNKWDSSWVS